MSEYVLEMKNITKQFGKLIANKDVNFDLKKGEVHALLGENGAGKTTLMNIIYGIYEQEKGDVFIKGEKIHIKNPKDVIALGVGMVHQHFMLVEPMTVLENVILGMENNIKKLNIKKVREELQQLCDSYHFNLDVNSKIKDLSVGMQQKVELVKALYRGADILILDEPTAVLTPLEVEELFVILKQFVDQGKSIIIISHKLWEVMKISDRVTVLRSGQVVGTVNTKDTTKEDLADMMVGRKVSLEYDKTPVAHQDAVIELENIYADGNQLNSSLKDISFQIRKGEILGLAGVDGNGQLELSEIMMGLRKIKAGQIRFNGKNINTLPTRSRIEEGFAHIPEDRMTQGLVMNFTVSENMVLNCYDKAPYTVNHVFQTNLVRKNGAELTEAYDVRPREPEALVRSFSGGNQQKVVIAREFSKDPKFILAVQPTRGLDIGASQFVHKRLLEEKEKGASVFLVSADLDEVLSVSDRVLVIFEGQITGEFVPGTLSYTEIGLMMGYSGDKTEDSVQLEKAGADK